MLTLERLHFDIQDCTHRGAELGQGGQMTKACGARWMIVLGWSLALAGVLPGPARGQVTRADYDRALGLREKYDGLVDHVPSARTWIEGTSHFIYRRSTIAAGGLEAGQEYVWVDAESGTSRPAFDHAKLADALTKAFGAPVKADSLPPGFHMVDKESALEI